MASLGPALSSRPRPSNSWVAVMIALVPPPWASHHQKATRKTRSRS